MESVDVQSESQLLVAGDTPNDLRVGANAGVRYVAGVLTGAHDVVPPSKGPHTHILASAATIPEVLGLDVDDTAIGSPPAAPHRPSVIELQLSAELAAARRQIAELTAELTTTSRAHDRLRDLLEAMAWHARWGRTFR
jgi:hypothetical protein